MREEQRRRVLGLKKPRLMGWVGMDRRGFVRVPGRQTDPARQNDNVE
jgi:hypothetical protein